MTFVDRNDPRVVQVVAHIRALRKMQRETRVLTFRTVNQILAELEPAILAAVALELEQNGEQNHDRRFAPLSTV